MSMRAAETEYLPADYADATNDPFSVIDRNSAFDGTFKSSRDLRIEGEAKGVILCDGTVFIAEGATVAAEVNAVNVTVAGDVEGEIRCRGKLQMLPSGRVKGKIATETLVIAEGAFYEGELTMVKPDERAANRPDAISGPTPVPINGQPAEPRPGAAGPTTFIRRLGSPETAWDTRNDRTPEPPAETDSTEQ